MKYYPIIILILVCNFSIGQNEIKLDALKIELSKISNDSIKRIRLEAIFNEYLFSNLDSAKVYHDKIVKIPKKETKRVIDDLLLSSKYYYYSSNIDSSSYFTEKALKQSLNLNNKKLTANLYRKLAILSTRKANYNKAEKYAELSLQTANLTKDWNLIASSNLILGNQYYRKTDFDKAMGYYLKVDSLYTLNNTTDRFLANCFDNMSSIYTDIKDEKALEYIDKAKAIYEALKDLEGVNFTYNLRGMYFQKMSKYNQAVSNYEKAMIFYKDYGDLHRRVEISCRLLSCYTALKEKNKADKLFSSLEQLISDENYYNEENLIYFYLAGGEIALGKQKTKKAIYYFNKADSIIKNHGINYSLEHQKNLNQGLSEAYLDKNDYQSASKYLTELIILKDSINSKNSINITKNIEAKYQTEKKEQEIALLKSEKEFTAQKQKNQRNLLVGGLGLTTLAGLFLFMLFRNRQKTNNKLKELDTAKSNFFANISHEFRTPLTLIKNPIEAAIDDASLSDKKREQFVMAKRNSDRLLSLVNQLLDLSKIDAGELKLRIQKGNTQNLISALAESFQYSAEEKNITYHLEIKNQNQDVWFDKDTLEKVTVNLLSNALKYTPEKGSIICDSYIENNKLHLNIKNTAKTLTNDALANLFTRFYQTDKQNQGTGIGLALVKELVELHKGLITVKSNNNWVAFSVILPVNKNSFKNEVFIDATKTKALINPEQTDASEAIAIELEANDKPILLIVEDNKDVRTLLKQTFETNYNVITAKNGQLGIDLALEQVPDIIISDIMMPVKGGIELTKTLKNNELTSHIPIILLTAKAGDENEIIGIEIGADDYITKPFNSKLLQTKVSNLIDVRLKLQNRYSQEIVLTPKDIAVTNLDEQFLKKVQEVLEENLIEPSFNIEGFSKAVGMSRMQLHRKIKALTGLSASEFVRSQRLKLAVELLKTSDINISQVGYSVGFNNHSYFAKCFKETYHCTPTEFANKHNNT